MHSRWGYHFYHRRGRHYWSPIPPSGDVCCPQVLQVCKLPYLLPKHLQRHNTAAVFMQIQGQYEFCASCDGYSRTGVDHASKQLCSSAVSRAFKM